MLLSRTAHATGSQASALGKAAHHTLSHLPQSVHIVGADHIVGTQ